MKIVLALLHKEALINFRNGEWITASLALALLLSVLVSFACQSALLSPTELFHLFPLFFWVLFLVSATLTATKAIEPELEEYALGELLLLGVPASSLFLTKWLAAVLVQFFTQIAIALILGILLNIPLKPVIAPLIELSALVTIGYAALSMLISPIAARARTKNLLMPFLLLPLLFPLLAGALTLNFDLFATGTLARGSFWYTLLITLDFVYLACGLTLFESVICE
jgi:heme exporter protein B